MFIHVYEYTGQRMLALTYTSIDKFCFEPLNVVIYTCLHTYQCEVKCVLVYMVDI